MNNKFSFTKSIRFVAVLGGLILAAFAGQTVLAKSDNRLAQANKPVTVQASRVELTARSASVQKPEIKLPVVTAPAADHAVAVKEAQPADDKGGTTLSQESAGAESSTETELNETQSTDDEDMQDVEVNETQENDVDSPEDEISQPTGEIEFQGTISAINGDALTINGMTVLISTTTEVKGTLMVGDMVKVEGVLQSGNTVQAAEIKVKSPETEDNVSSQPSSTSTEDRHGISSSSSSGEHHDGSHSGDNPKGDD